MDGTMKNARHSMHIHYALGDAQEMLRQHRIGSATAATLFSRGTRTRTFFTADSHRYITPSEREALLTGVRRTARTGQFDSVQLRYARPSHGASEVLYRHLEKRYSNILETLRYLPDMFAAHISPMRVLNASIIGAIFFGMFSMTLIYRYLGQQASAESGSMRLAQAPVVSEASMQASTGSVLGASTEASLAEVNAPESTPPAAVAPVLTPDMIDQKRFDAEVTAMVKGYPIEAMLPYILKQDRDVAAFLIGIGKKESNWGKRVPVLNGKDCYNYWGYRGIRDAMGTGGHTCFNSPEDAVTTVGKRIQTLVQEKKLSTPAKMIVWKCGSTCAGHKPADVRKWISDVAMYLPTSK